MKKIRIITDCTSDLTKQIYEENDILVLPLYVTIGGKTYSDGIDITTKEMYELVNKYNELPKSSNISPTTFEETFRNELKNYDEIIYLGIGSKMSSTYNNACFAAREVDPSRIFIVDSENLSSGIGLLILRAVKLRKQGLSAFEISEELKKITPLVRTQFVINTLEYLHKGGRCTGTVKIIGTLLKIKPIIRVAHGEMEIAKKPMGKFERGLEVLLGYVKDDLENIETDNIMVTHSETDKDADYLINELKKMNKFENIIKTSASGVISTHCGPRTIGILYILKK